MLNLVENIFAMESRWIKNCLWLVLALFVLLIDQVTKTLAITYLQFGVANELMPGISLTLAHNTGAAFSLFNQGNGWQIIFFTVLAIIVSIYLTIWLIRSKKE
ncbi:MAG: signal peptidase II, partial [Legionellales bacterium]|nr:signal peptidase II [Legionellales bacterium]